MPHKRMFQSILDLRALVTELQTTFDTGEGPSSPVERMHQINVVTCMEALLQDLEGELYSEVSETEVVISKEWVM